jgi:hypothetical protein
MKKIGKYLSVGLIFLLIISMVTGCGTKSEQYF